MAKKNNVSINALEKYCKQTAPAVVEQTIPLNDEESLTFIIKPRLSLEDCVRFIEDVVSEYINPKDTMVVPIAKEFIIGQNLLTYYANFTMPSNTEKAFDLVMGSFNIMNMILEHIDRNQYGMLLRAIDERYKADIYYAFMEVLQVFSNTLYTSIGSIAIALFGSDMIRKGQMPDTGINDFTTYKGRVDQYQAEVLTHYQTLKGTQGAMQYVGVLLDGPEEDPDAGYDLPEGQPEQDIVLDRVSFGYVPQQPVLHDLSLTIPAGKTTAIIGNNGCGKSTLLKLLQGVYPPDSGRVWLGKTAVDEVKLAQLRRRFGCVLQHNPLFSGSVRDNIAYGETEAVSDEAIAGAARLADADGFIRQLPQGYDSDVGMGGALLSGGQRQRVAIARTLLSDPDYLLMDEAGASLDHKSGMTIFRTVREHMKGRTIVVVAHDMRTVMEADHIIVLNSGSLEAAGTHEELLGTSPTYRAYLQLQGCALAGEEVSR